MLPTLKLVKPGFTRASHRAACKSGIDATGPDPKIHPMTTTFPTEEMKADRSATLGRLRRQHQIDEARLRQEMDLPVWHDWMFWLGAFLMAAHVNHQGIVQPAWPLGLIVMTVALDRVSRRRTRAAREMQMLQEEKRLLPGE